MVNWLLIDYRGHLSIRENLVEEFHDRDKLSLVGILLFSSRHTRETLLEILVCSKWCTVFCRRLRLLIIKSQQFVNSLYRITLNWIQLLESSILNRVLQFPPSIQKIFSFIFTHFLPNLNLTVHFRPGNIRIYKNNINLNNYYIICFLGEFIICYLLVINFCFFNNTFEFNVIFYFFGKC